MWEQLLSSILSSLEPNLDKKNVVEKVVSSPK